MNDQLSLFGAAPENRPPRPPTGEAIDPVLCEQIALSGIMRNQGWDPTRRASDAAVDQGHGPVSSDRTEVTEATEATEPPEAATATTHELIAEMRLALGSTGSGRPLSNGARHATRTYIEGRKTVLGQ